MQLHTLQPPFLEENHYPSKIFILRHEENVKKKFFQSCRRLFFNRCAPIELARKATIAGVLKICRQHCQKHPKNQFDLNGQTKRKVQKFQKTKEKQEKQKKVKQKKQVRKKQSQTTEKSKNKRKTKNRRNEKKTKKAETNENK